MTDLPFYSLILIENFNKKKQENPQYSLRGFARDLEVHPAVLSLVMKGKRSLPQRDADSVLAKLALTNEETSLFLSSLKKS